MGWLVKLDIDPLNQTHPIITAISDLARKSIPEGIDIYDDYKTLIELDCIFISLPNQFVCRGCLSHLQNGLHVFCEKPPARTHAELLEVEKQSLKFPELKLMLVLIIDTKLLIDSNSLGRLIMKGVYGKSQMISFNQTDWRTDRDSGILLDQGIHMLDLSALLMFFSIIDNAF